jgi:hypothetical protein
MTLVWVKAILVGVGIAAALLVVTLALMHGRPGRRSGQPGGSPASDSIPPRENEAPGTGSVQGMNRNGRENSTCQP